MRLLFGNSSSAQDKALHRLLGASTLTFVIAACGGGESSDSGSAGSGGESASTTAASSTGMTATGSGGGGGDASCGLGTVPCGEQCVDTDFDPAHCGGCDLACAEGEVCSMGTCAVECLGGSTKCGAACVDTDFDPQHCGGCDTVCPEGEVCSQGECAVTCLGGTTKCGSQCIDLADDPEHCGACGNVCSATGANTIGVCSQAACDAVCTGSFENCDGLAANGCETNVLSSNAHCGACGSPCGQNANCVNGTCEKKCYAISLDGVDDYTSTSTSAGYSYTGNYTVETWYYGDSTKRSSTFAPSEISDALFVHGGCCGGINGGNYYSLLYFDATTTSPNFRWMIDLGSNKLLANVPTTYNAWHHVAVQQSASAHQVFIDGVSVVSGSGQVLPGAGGESFPIQLGGNQGNPGPGRWSLGGKIGPTRVSSILRYAGPFMPKWGWVNDPSTIALWNLTEGAGNTTLDSSGNARTVTFYGPSWTEVACPAP
jgi:hypothetical protein